MTLKVDVKFEGKVTHEGKMTWSSVNFYVSSRKSENLHFDGFLLPKAYKFTAKRCLSWDSRVMQALKKNWL